MTVTTMNDNTALHDCPHCGIQCAVSIAEMRSAHDAGKDIRIACHGCGDVFNPVNGTSENALDIAICPKCSDQFSVPPLPKDKDVTLSCPLCNAEVLSTDMKYHQHDGKIIKKRSAWSVNLSGLFNRQKKAKDRTPKEPTIQDTSTTNQANEETTTNSVIIDDLVSDVSAPTKVIDKEQTGGSVVTRLFKQNSKKSEPVKADSRPKQKSTMTRPLALVSLLVILIGVAIGGFAVLSPTKPAQMLEIFMAQQVKPANFSITNAVYERVETSVGKSVVITVTITNTGNSNGTPGTVVVELLDAARQPILSWPVTTNALNIGAGENRALVTRIFEPPSAFNDIQVTLASN